MAAAAADVRGVRAAAGAHAARAAVRVLVSLAHAIVTATSVTAKTQRGCGER